MREVIPNALWIGNARDARDVTGVLAAGIDVVIDLALEEPPIPFPRDIVYCRFPLLDGAGNAPALLRSIIDTTANFVAAERPTLVACSGGMSRSPVIASAAIAQAQSIDLEAAALRVTETGPCDFSPGLWSDVHRLDERTTPHSRSRRNLFADLPTRLPEELIEVLAENQHVRIERIVSTGHASPAGFWYNQSQAEWVIVLKGEAQLLFEGDAAPVCLRPGDYVLIPAHRKHRVEGTTPTEPTVWLAVFFHK